MKRLTFIFAVTLLCVPALAGNVKGRVTAEGKPMAGVIVSDGVNFTRTDADGRYDMLSDKTTGTVFITAPSGYRCALKDNFRPAFWQYLVCDADKDEIHDFILEKEDQSTYTMLFPADIHLTNDPRRQDIERFRQIAFPVIQKIAAESEGPAYTSTLGDTTHDVYWYEYNFNESDAVRLFQDIGYPTPMFNVMGNHDHDPSIVGKNVDDRAEWRFRDCWGPKNYSVNIGGDHWIYLDDIYYINVEGKGKKAPGVKGDRSYKHRFTEAQMAWLEKDLSFVSPDAGVYICLHCPPYKGSNSSCYLPEEQLKAIDAMGARFAKGITFFAGHVHFFDIFKKAEFPNIMQYALPSVAGTLWETPIEWPLYNSDGGDAGVFYGTFTEGREPEFHYGSFIGGERYFRIYDMNEVGKVYKASPDVKKQQEMFKETRLDYSQSKWKNYVFVNYWGWRPGDTVEAYENGKLLKMEKFDYEDPTKNFAYDLQILGGNVQHHKPSPKSACYHMYEFKCRTAKSPVTVKFLDKDGNVRFEETVQRPLPFNPSGK